MSKLSDVLRNRRKQLGLTLAQIADQMNVTEATVQRWESGNIKSIRHEKIGKLADILNVSPAQLMGWEEEKENSYFEVTGPYPIGKLVNLPMIASVRAGFDGLIEADIEAELVAVPLYMLNGYPPKECVTFRVKGDSMYPRILEGDIVIVHLQASVDSGQTAIVIYNGDEGTLKKVKYKKGEDWLELIPANPEYPTKRIEGIDIESCRVYGHVIGLQRSFE